MFTDVNVKFPYNGLKNCCKTKDYLISDSELQELEKNGQNVLTHNSEYLRRKKSMLIDNKLPKRGCTTCLQAEPNSLFRSWNTWVDKDLSDTDQFLYGDNFTNYEFVLSSACDLKCVYCSEKDSSSWAKELGVPVNRGNEQWKEKILAALLDHLKHKTFDPSVNYWFFFSGGEPTYNPETLTLIEKIIEIVPQPNIILSTNANTKPKVLDRYIAVVRKYPNVRWRFHCSVDDIGEHAEAIRHGMNWNNTIANLKRLMAEPNITVRICPTVNLYSVPRMSHFVEFFYNLFSEHNHVTLDMFDFNMVQEPQLSPWSMPEEYKPYLDAPIAYCKERGLNFSEHLINVQNLIGTNINETTASKIESKWKYFQMMRPENDWKKLFPHVDDIINVLNERVSK
jgi:sulfatase maturation enzyme AslB (radical SAM superfamily)